MRLLHKTTSTPGHQTFKFHFILKFLQSDFSFQVKENEMILIGGLLCQNEKNDVRAKDRQ